MPLTVKERGNHKRGEILIFKNTQRTPNCYIFILIHLLKQLAPRIGLSEIFENLDI